jgi:hypothetical protein
MLSEGGAGAFSGSGPSAEHCPPELCLDAPLAEEARNRDHDSSNECEQERQRAQK